MALSEGTEAPGFRLPPAEDPESRVTLSDTEGKKRVLLFFPVAFTSVCTEEMCRASEDLSQYRRLNADVFGISVDSPFSQQAWKEEEEFSLPLLSDFNRQTIKDYDVVMEDLLGLEELAKRAAFVIDEEGIIRYSWEADDPARLPPFEEIKETLESP